MFRASRLSQGNRLFPTQVAISPTSVTHFTPQWIGKLEESIHISHIASIKIDTNIMFSDVKIDLSVGDLTISVVENPIINRVLFEGNSGLKEDKLRDEVTVLPSVIFTRAKA